MKVLRFVYNAKEHILNISDISYTLGNIMAVIDIYFKESRLEEPAKVQLVVSLENLDEFMEIISNKTYIELNNVGNFIESMKCYHRVSGYVLEEDKEKVEKYLNTEPEETLLEYSDTIHTQEELSEYDGESELGWSGSDSTMENKEEQDLEGLEGQGLEGQGLEEYVLNLG